MYVVTNSGDEEINLNKFSLGSSGSIKVLIFNYETNEYIKYNDLKVKIDKKKVCCSKKYIQKIPKKTSKRLSFKILRRNGVKKFSINLEPGKYRLELIYDLDDDIFFLNSSLYNSAFSNQIDFKVE